jgi:hypothetical protein
VVDAALNPSLSLPYSLRIDDFRIAMQDVYDFFYDVNRLLDEKGLGGAVDTHGARDQWMCVFVYEMDNTTEPAVSRAPMRFLEAYLGRVTVDDFRRNPRGELGTRTATLDRSGIAKLRANWLYRLQ